MKKNSFIPTYPQVGDVIYWKDDYEGNMHEHGGSFVTTDDILDPLSEEVQEFKKKLHKEKMKKFIKMISTPEIYCELRKRLGAVYGDEAANILKVLTDENQ